MRLCIHSFCYRNRAQELEREAHKVHAPHGVVQPGMWALPYPGTAQVSLEPTPYSLDRAAYVSPAIGCVDRLNVSLHLFFNNPVEN